MIRHTITVEVSIEAPWRDHSDYHHLRRRLLSAIAHETADLVDDYANLGLARVAVVANRKHSKREAESTVT